MFTPVHNPDILSFLTAHYSIALQLDTLSSLALPNTFNKSIQNVSPKRKLDFLAGRFCALKALEKSGVRGIPEIPILPSRSPDWPDGWVGSITHTEGFASAAVASKNALRSLGIDSERIMSCETANEVARLTLLPSEIVYWEINLKSIINFETYVTLVFSAKESVYKCLHPIMGEYIDFLDVKLFTIDLNHRKFNFKLLKTLSFEFYSGFCHSGRFEISYPFIHTAIELIN